MALPRSPLAPASFPDIPPVPGVRFASAACNLRYRGRHDLTLVDLVEGTHVAGVFTRSLTAGHPVIWCRRILPRGRARGLVVNAGNANVFRAAQGEEAVRIEAGAVAEVLACEPEDVFVASTGVIGEALDAGRIAEALPGLAAKLGPEGIDDAARAIMTTDTFHKGACATAEIGGHPVTVAGIAKGSGMIAPDMATMLAFIFTDAALPHDVLQPVLEAAVDRSFNAITVDGDTSTSDTVLLFATGRAAHPRISGHHDPLLDDFRHALDTVALDLAHQIVRDGEGASKFIAIRVTGAADDRSARRIGLAIGNSPLVKTAIAGEDANWGRVVMAVGKAGEPVEPWKLAVAFGGVQVARDGVAVTGYDEAPVAAHLKGREIEIVVDVGVGAGEATVWTCDLTDRYIAINADYRS